MEEKENEYKSCIIGQAIVNFGGKVAIKSGMTTMYHLPGISFSELYESGEPGRRLSDDDRRHEPQVVFTFDNIRSVDILQRHLNNCREILKRQMEQQSKSELTGILAEKVTDFDFSCRVINFFRAYGINTVADLVRLQKTDVLKWRQFGKKAFLQVDEFIRDHGLQWGMNI